MSETKFEDADGDEYEAVLSDRDGEKALIDLSGSGGMITFFAEDAERIIRIIQEATA